VEVALPKKRGAGAVAGFKDAMDRFLLRTYDAVKAHVRFDIVKCLLIAGPGFAKDTFREYLLETAGKRGDKQILGMKESIVKASASTAYLQGIEVNPHHTLSQSAATFV
jgi:protein pelota